MKFLQQLLTSVAAASRLALQVGAALLDLLYKLVFLVCHPKELLAAIGAQQFAVQAAITLPVLLALVAILDTVLRA